MAEVRIVIPTFDGRLSKNKNNSLRRIQFGRDAGVKQVRDSFVLFIRGTVSASGIKFNPESLGIELLVYRPDKRYDGQNFADEFCDIIQGALGINDRHFKDFHCRTIDGQYPHFEIILRGDG